MPKSGQEPQNPPNTGRQEGSCLGNWEEGGRLGTGLARSVALSSKQLSSSQYLGNVAPNCRLAWFLGIGKVQAVCCGVQVCLA